MRGVSVGMVGLGNVGKGTLAILAGNARDLSAKLGFPLRVAMVCSRGVSGVALPEGLGEVTRTTDWRDVVEAADVDIVVELVGGAGAAREIVQGAISAGKSVVTANKELMALCGPELAAAAHRAGVGLAMEASVAGGIPIHAVLREGIGGDSPEALYGILNGTCNYILTEIERHERAFAEVLAEAQALGYAEADPSADVDGLDARSKLAILSGLAFGQRIAPADIHTEGIRRISPVDFQYAHRLGYTIRLICVARRESSGLLLSVRPALIAQSTILASVTGAYNAVWVRGRYGADTFYYGKGAGPLPTGVAVVSDLMRLARAVQEGNPGAAPPFGFTSLESKPLMPLEDQVRAWYLRFRVRDRPGIIAALSGILADKQISLDAVLQLPTETKADLPFVITLEPTREQAVREAVSRMGELDFVTEPPLALPMETAL
jgi:homoserine dehydrogenase